MQCRKKFANVLGIAGAILLSGLVADVCRATMADCIDATCRITAPDGGRGSGCVFEISDGQIYVLTAAHVVEHAATAQCEFWRHGHQSQPVSARLVRQSQAADAAVLAVASVELGGVLPAVVPLAPRDYTLSPTATLTSVGCANGAWSTLWQGHLLACRDGELRFLPVPAGGRSGSAIFDAEGKQIVGLLRARTADNSEGIANDLQTIYRAFDHRASQHTMAGDSAWRASEVPVQCPGGNCPGGACPSGNCPNGQCPLRPRTVWPTLPHVEIGPRVEVEPARPPVDLAPLDNKLGRLIDITEGLSRQQTPPAPMAVPNGPDAATVQALQQMGGQLQQHAQAIEQIRTDVPRVVNEAVRPLADKLGTVESAVKPIMALKERLDEDAQAGGLRGKIAQRLEQDLADPTAWIKHAGIAVAVVLVLVFGAALIHAIHAHKKAMQNGQPSAAEKALDDIKAKLQTAAVAAPALAPVAAGATALDSLLHKLLDQQSVLQSTLAGAATANSPSAATPAAAAPAAPASPVQVTVAAAPAAKPAAA
jgi:hypothetical protein